MVMNKDKPIMSIASREGRCRSAHGNERCRMMAAELPIRNGNGQHALCENANVMSESGDSSSIVVPETPLPDTARPFRFTWDPAAARRPGPESVSGTTTDGRADYFATRLGDLPFNTSSTSLALGVLPGDWSSSRYGFHGACCIP